MVSHSAVRAKSSVGEVSVRSGSEIAQALSPDALRDVLELMYAEIAKTSRRTYRQALHCLANHLSVPVGTHALALLISAGPVEAHRLAYAWRDAMEAEGRATNTRATWISSLHSAWSILMRLGFVGWPLHIKRPKVKALRDTRGPKLDLVRVLADTARGQGGIKALRDTALVAVVFGMALRRSEVASRNVNDLDREGRRLLVVGKGDDDATWITMPSTVTDAICAYLDARNAKDGEPLFTTLDRRSRGRPEQLTDNGIYKVIVNLARQAGIPSPVSPHRLRHSAITTALDASQGDVRRVQRFSRHSKIDTVMVYDDRRLDPAGEIAAMVTGALGAEHLRVGTEAPGIDSEHGADGSDSQGTRGPREGS